MLAESIDSNEVNETDRPNDSQEEEIIQEITLESEDCENMFSSDRDLNSQPKSPVAGPSGTSKSSLITPKMSTGASNFSRINKLKTEQVQKKRKRVTDTTTDKLIQACEEIGTNINAVLTSNKLAENISSENLNFALSLAESLGHINDKKNF